MSDLERRITENQRDVLLREESRRGDRLSMDHHPGKWMLPYHRHIMTIHVYETSIVRDPQPYCRKRADGGLADVNLVELLAVIYSFTADVRGPQNRGDSIISALLCNVFLATISFLRFVEVVIVHDLGITEISTVMHSASLFGRISQLQIRVANFPFVTIDHVRPDPRDRQE